MKNTIMQTDEQLFRKWLEQDRKDDRTAARLKEQIDSLMGEEIGKTIETLHMYIERVKAT